MDNQQKKAINAKVNEITKEAIWLLAVFVMLLAALKIAYYKESFFTTLRAAAAVTWLFVLPGYSFMLLWKDRLSLTERVVIGAAAAAAIIGVSSYYLGLTILNISQQLFLLPAAVIIISLIVYFGKR